MSTLKVNTITFNSSPEVSLRFYSQKSGSSATLKDNRGIEVNRPIRSNGAVPYSILKYNGNTSTILKSFNISSVTKNAAGQYWCYLGDFGTGIKSAINATPQFNCSNAINSFSSHNGTGLFWASSTNVAIWFSNYSWDSGVHTDASQNNLTVYLVDF